MAKILKNTTLSDIALDSVGFLVPASGQYIINPQEYREVATDDLLTEITPHLTSGDLVVNDGVNDLSLSKGLYYLQFPDWAFNQRFLSNPDRVNGFVSKTTQEAIEEARDSFRSKSLSFVFSSTGLTKNKWLNVGHPSSPSDSVPFVCPWAASAYYMNFSNVNDLCETDLQFFVNGSLAYTWQIRDKRTAWQVSNAGLFTLNQGDRISIYANQVNPGTDPSNIFGEVGLTGSALVDGSGGTDSGV